MSLYGSLTAAYDLGDRAGFDRIMDAWEAAAPWLLPTRAGITEPVRQPFDLADREAAAGTWDSLQWIARRAKPQLEAIVMPSTRVHSTLSIRVRSGNDRLLADFVALILALADATSPVFGVIHRLTSAEVADARLVRRPDLMVINRLTGDATLGIGYTRQLEHGIPSLYWQTLLGRPYVELFGTQRILDAPASQVRHTGWGMILQLTESAPTDASWPEFRARRDAVADQLGRAAFWPDASLIPPEITDYRGLGNQV